MRKFWIVLRYELKEYFCNKGFMAFTIILALFGSLALFAPRVFDLSNLTGVQVVNRESEDASFVEEGSEDVQDTENTEDAADKDLYLYIDQAGVVREDVLKQLNPSITWQQADDVEALKSAIENQEAEAGFVVKSPEEFDYYLYNTGLYDSKESIFFDAMQQFYRINYCEENNLDLNEIEQMYHAPVQANSVILNKDTGSNYWYCYGLIILIFMMIMLYGQMTAVAVTNEKSNRAIEVLVTTTTPNSLLFGKVIASAIGGVVQMGVILGGILCSYQINREQWGGLLDIVLHIPSSVLWTFAFFGLGGYLFYAFLFGAMGALVSKTEDVSKTAGTLNMIIMVVYFFALFQLGNIEGPIIKVLSFLPFSSYSTMFARIAMGTVAPWEIGLSFVILVVSIYLAGVLGAKLYRMGTLRYGNPIKLSTAIKDLKKAE